MEDSEFDFSRTIRQSRVQSVLLLVQVALLFIGFIPHASLVTLFCTSWCNKLRDSLKIRRCNSDCVTAEG